MRYITFFFLFFMVSLVSATSHKVPASQSVSPSSIHIKKLEEMVKTYPYEESEKQIARTMNFHTLNLNKILILRLFYLSNAYPKCTEIEDIVSYTKLTRKQVSIWFNNERAKKKALAKRITTSTVPSREVVRANSDPDKRLKTVYNQPHRKWALSSWHSPIDKDIFSLDLSSLQYQEPSVNSALNSEKTFLQHLNSQDG